MFKEPSTMMLALRSSSVCEFYLQGKTAFENKAHSSTTSLTNATTVINNVFSYFPGTQYRKFARTIALQGVS